MRAPTPLALVLLGGMAVAAAAQEPFHWTGRLAAGKRLEIKGVNGAVRAVGVAAGSQVEVTATKSARRSDPASVEIKVLTTGRRARHENECTAGDHWSTNTDDNDVVVDFDVKVPAGVKFYGQTVNGGVEAEHLASDAQVYTVNGSIRVSTSGYAEATTVNGSIVASLGKADWTDGLEFTTVNGGITLDLPASFSAEVHAKTLNGDVVSDFPLLVSGRFGPRNFHGTVGAGGRSLDLSTNGTVTAIASTPSYTEAPIAKPSNPSLCLSAPRSNVRIVTGLLSIPSATARYASNCSSSDGRPARLRNRNSERNSPTPVAPFSSACSRSSRSRASKARSARCSRPARRRKCPPRSTATKTTPPTSRSRRWSTTGT